MLITVTELEARTGQTYTGAELARVNALIDDVSALIEDYAKTTWTDPVPRAIKAIAALEVRRHLNSEPGVSTERIGELSSSYANGGAVVVLSDSAKTAISRALRASRQPFFTIQLVRPECWPEEEPAA